MRKFEFTGILKEAKEGGAYRRFPERSTAKSAGYDFFVPEDTVCKSHEITMVKTGVKAYFPDDETLLEQLFERISTDKQLMPIIETLDTKNLISIIDKLKSNSAKCKLLLSRWCITENRFDKENSTTQKSIDINLQKQLISPYGYNRFEKEYLSETIADILFEVIQDDTTSNQEAIDLMYRYYNIVTEEKRAYFDEIIEYLRQN